jgi:hypothetical protein
VALLVFALAPLACSFDASGPAGARQPDGAPTIDGSGSALDASDVADARAAADASRSDGGGDLCGGPDRDTIALYRFDAQGDLTDATGVHDGALVGPPLDATQGPPGCGMAVEFPAAAQSFITVADPGDFDLDEGSIDLLVRAPPAGVERGLISRDSGANLPGHFTAVIDSDGRFVARLQGTASDAVVCSDQLAVAGQWHHLAINFGPPGAELYLDGVRGTNQDPVVILVDQNFNCNTAHDEGIDGNDLPWVFGADNSLSPDGETGDARSFFSGGAIDQLRLSRTRRPFDE